MRNSNARQGDLPRPGRPPLRLILNDAIDAQRQPTAFFTAPIAAVVLSNHR